MNPSRILHSNIACVPMLLWLLLVRTGALAAEAVNVPDDSRPLRVKAAWFQRDLLDKHWLKGLYVSIMPGRAAGNTTRAHR